MNKLTIDFQTKNTASFNQRHVRFYFQYAYLVLKNLRDPLFQRFLRWMLKRESIEEHMISRIQVMVFPHRKGNGRVLAGRCNTGKGEIRLYPKRLRFCWKLRQKVGKKNVHAYIKGRSEAALIHELLHIKYSSDEAKVRNLTRKYFTMFIEHENNRGLNLHSILKILFRY